MMNRPGTAKEMDVRRVAIGILLATTLIGCESISSHRESAVTRVSLPVLAGWYEGKRIYYITTEVSDPQMAVSAGATYAPRLWDALPPTPRPPDWATVLDRVYKFAANDQDAVFASAPRPLGPGSTDTKYSPLWIAYMVSWNAVDHRRPLLSEATILDAEASGEVTVVRTDIVINCPIVATAAGSRLPNAELQ
jgi:hypothetical protein